VPAAVLLLLAGFSSGDAGPASLPDSVTPCLPCHNQGNSDQVVEWLASPYSEREGGRGCTDCHGRSCSGNEVPRALDDGLDGPESPRPIEAARLIVRAVCSDADVTAEVAVSNVGVGHLLPTGSAKRTLLVEVAAHDRNQAPLPPWNHPKPPAVNQAEVGLRGRGLANGTLPGATVTVQPRMLPFATDVIRHRFVAPESGPVRVTARLLLVPVTGVPSEIARSASVCGPPGDEP
jgi:hypothetical protein